MPRVSSRFRVSLMESAASSPLTWPSSYSSSISSRASATDTVDIRTSPSPAFMNTMWARSSSSTSRSMYPSMPKPLYTKTSEFCSDCMRNRLGSQSCSSTPGGRNMSTVSFSDATALVNS